MLPFLLILLFFLCVTEEVSECCVSNFIFPISPVVFIACVESLVKLLQ